MRPQQQGRRQRNRNSGGGNRRNQNPLSRNYESNGPDVKIRGNAQVIADKYATLARDALSSGDSVMAENYLQHAEHYNRIIMAAQAQMQAQRDERQQSDDDNDDGGVATVRNGRIGLSVRTGKIAASARNARLPMATPGRTARMLPKHRSR